MSAVESDLHRGRLSHVVAFTWLALLTLMAATTHVILRHAVSDWQDQGEHEPAAATQDDVNALSSRLDLVISQKPVSLATYATRQQTTDQRIATLAQEVSDRATTGNLQALIDRVDGVEKQLAITRRGIARSKAAESITSAANQTSAALLPPFSIVGIESRGGQRFLSIAPSSASSIGELRLLRPGDSEADWRLDSLGPNTAQFTVNGITREVSIP